MLVVLTRVRGLGWGAPSAVLFFERRQRGVQRAGLTNIQMRVLKEEGPKSPHLSPVRPGPNGQNADGITFPHRRPAQLAKRGSLADTGSADNPDSRFCRSNPRCADRQEATWSGGSPEDRSPHRDWALFLAWSAGRAAASRRRRQRRPRAAARPRGSGSPSAGSSLEPDGHTDDGPRGFRPEVTSALPDRQSSSTGLGGLSAATVSPAPSHHRHIGLPCV